MSWQSFLNIQGHVKIYCLRYFWCVETEAVLLLSLTWRTEESQRSLFQPFAITCVIPPCWPSMTVPANWDDTKWPLSWLLPCCCYSADHCQFIEAPYFIEDLCSKNKSPSIIWCIYYFLGNCGYLEWIPVFMAVLSVPVRLGHQDITVPGL